LQVIINESNISDIQAEYEGPAGTPFEGGLFRMKLVLGSDFPNAPPKGKLYTSCSPLIIDQNPCFSSKIMDPAV
jgi:ubiquitin-protein ligase